METTLMPGRIALALRSCGAIARPAKLAHIAFAAFVVLTAIAIWVPFSPNMPASSLDKSWSLGMNEAIASGLAVGREIVFTVGPYASIYTGEYHPGTDRLMLLGSAFLGLTYALALLYAAGRAGAAAAAATLLFLAASSVLRDPLLLSFPPIVAVAAVRANDRSPEALSAASGRRRLGLTALLVSPLGLLPLVKGSLLLGSLATMLALCAFLLHRRRYAAACAALAAPAVAFLLFWALAGQSLRDVPGYFATMIPLMAGYTEAMASAAGDGHALEPVAFLGAALAILWAQAKGCTAAPDTKVFLFVCFAAFLLLSFKAGFVREDHAIIGAGCAVVGALILGLTSPGPRYALALLAAICAWAFIDQARVGTSTGKLVEQTQAIYTALGDGLRRRFSSEDSLPLRFARAMEEIRRQTKLPLIAGSTDIYSHGQADLIAAGNRWNPRPVFQSYAAYSPVLAQMNASHLRGDRRPDNIVFKLEPIDLRLPSLEDGASWPALIDNYRAVGWQAGSAVFSRREKSLDDSDFSLVARRRIALGKPAEISLGSSPLFVKIDLRPTVLGQLLEFFYKPPELTMTLRLANGEERVYRTISNMMESGFFLSPLIESTQELVFLAAGHASYMDTKRVATMEIAPSYGAGWLWPETFRATFARYERHRPADPLPAGLADRFDRTAEASYARGEAVSCEGRIDRINGADISAPQIETDGLVTVEGWLAISGAAGRIPDRVFVALQEEGGATRYLEARRKPRPDVAQAYGNPKLPDVGFAATADLGAMGGDYSLRIERVLDGVLQPCSWQTVRVHRRESR